MKLSTAAARRIWVSTAHDPASSTIRVVIRDDGRGIPPEDMLRIMDPFFTTRRNQGGTGLGISIAANLVKHVFGVILLDPI